jgi:isochorismate synthase EntC
LGVSGYSKTEGMDRDKYDILFAEKLVRIGELRVLSEAFAGTAEKSVNVPELE